MALTDFLTEGAPIPAGSGVKSMTSQTIIPDWYTNSAMQLIANQNAILAKPYEAAPMPRVAAFTPAQQQGFGMTQTAATAYQPALDTATAATQNTLGQNAMGAASPYFANAGKSSVSDISSYMNPYTDQVVNRIGEMAGRNLSENILPQLTSKYLTAGQLGFGPRGAISAPSGMMTDTARAIRGVQEAALAEQAKALQGGYTEAATLASGDLNRQAEIGKATADITGADITRQMQGAVQMADMAGLAQKYGLTGADAVTGVGAQEQALAQRNLDAARADWQAQRDDPQKKINDTLATLTGVQGMVPMGTRQEGIEPLSYQQQNAPSTIDQFIAGVPVLTTALKDFGLLP